MSDTISITRFVDFVIKTGTPKITSVKTTKEQLSTGYDPRTDFYKAFREEVVAMHKASDPNTRLDTLLTGLTDDKKKTAYPALLAGYKKFYKIRSTWPWFDPPKGSWDHGGVEVNVNPELGLEVAGTPTVLKLYFKEAKPSKRELAIINHLQRITLYDASKPNRIFGVLDVRRGRIIPEVLNNSLFTALLQGEAASFKTIWDAI